MTYRRLVARSATRTERWTPMRTVPRVLHDEAQRLEAFLRTVSPADWHRPSRCDQWQVADVVAHLIEDRHADRITRGLQGDLTPSGFVPSGTMAYRRLARLCGATPSHPPPPPGRCPPGSVLCGECPRGRPVSPACSPRSGIRSAIIPSGPLTVRRPGHPAPDGGGPCTAGIFVPALIRRHRSPRRVSGRSSTTIPRVVRRVCRPDATRTRALRYRWHMTTPPTSHDGYCAQRGGRIGGV